MISKVPSNSNPTVILSSAVESACFFLPLDLDSFFGVRLTYQGNKVLFKKATELGCFNWTVFKAANIKSDVGLAVSSGMA